jgi:alpha-tubulin suppressor-like RCC1 family protein
LFSVHTNVDGERTFSVSIERKPIEFITRSRWEVSMAQILRKQPRSFFPLLTSALLASCLLLPDAHEAQAQCVQTQTEAEHHGDRNNLSLELNSEQPRTVTVQITGPGIEKPLHYQLCAGQGKQGVGVHVPPGKGRQIELAVLDGQGKVTHRGGITISVTESPMASTNVPLVSTRAKDPLEATIGTYRVAVQQEPSKDGKSLSERVEVLDPEGRPVNIRSDQITLRTAAEPIAPLHPEPTPSPEPHLNINNFPRLGPNFPIVICFVNMTCTPIPRPIFFLPFPFQAIAAGGLGGLTSFEFTCAIDTSGQAWCWGENDVGELASGFASSSTCENLFPCSLVPLPVEQGKITFKSVPANTQVPESFLTAGLDFACAIDTTGVAWCWGGGQEDNFGELGVTGGPLPQQVGGAPFAAAHKFLSLSAGGNHACGVTTDQKLFCWGRNTSGELGINSTNPAGPPTQVTITEDIFGIQFPAPVTAVAAGSFHTCALTVFSHMFCWGDDETGELGIDFTATPTDRCPGNPGETQFCKLTPVQVQTDGSKASGLWDRLSAGGFFTCGRDQTTQQLFCWGSDTEGQLGIGPPSPVLNASFNPAPLLVSAPVTLNLIASHEGQSCGMPFVVNGPGNLFCWGTNTFAQPAILAPTSVPGHAFLAFAPGGTQTCAVDTNDAAWCWGDNTMGELGNNTTNSSATPVQVVP